uniref:Uncharacterized protein n=1 Tax=Molossus molossus TaxID=27622 RepID=A0A7J8I8M4_MOLMO|nr:hypothetical protein HJG59_010701 [Molossus molossus]
MRMDCVGEKQQLWLGFSLSSRGHLWMHSYFLRKRKLDWIGLVFWPSVATQKPTSKLSTLVQQQSFLLLMSLQCGWDLVDDSSLSHTGSSAGAGGFTFRWFAHIASKLVLAVGLEPSRSVGQCLGSYYTDLSMDFSGFRTDGSWVPRASIPREQSKRTWHFYKLNSEVT